MDKKLSPATERKIKIIEDHFGPDWNNANRSIDSLYNEATGDDRKNVFCKINPDAKKKLDEILEFYNTRMSDFFEVIIEKEYKEHKTRLENMEKMITTQFLG